MNDRILIDPTIQHGKPVIRGTRVPVARILGSLGAQMTMEEVEEEYGIAREDILAALAFAGEILEQEAYYPLPTATS